MAVRRPLKLLGTLDYQEMSDTEINNLCLHGAADYAIYRNPQINVQTSGLTDPVGTMISDRRTAGASATRQDRYPTESETAEPGSTTSNFNRMQMTFPPESIPSTNQPVYLESNGVIRTMSNQDILDTFVYQALDQACAYLPYRITTGTTVTNYTRVGNIPVMEDYINNIGLYTASGIGEAIDQFTTYQNYYLQRRTGGVVYPSVAFPAFIDTNVDTKLHSDTSWQDFLGQWMRYTARNTTGYRIRYKIATSVATGEYNCGDGASYRRDGGGNYQRRFVNANDYRAQEFVNGNLVLVRHNYFVLYRV